jgi:hypothetical protein
MVRYRCCLHVQNCFGAEKRSVNSASLAEAAAHHGTARQPAKNIKKELRYHSHAGKKSHPAMQA